MKNLKNIKLFENFDRLDEAVQSQILKNIIGSDLIKQVRGGIDHTVYGQMDWANLKDEDFLNISPKEARGKKYENSILFWFKNDKLVGASHGKNVYKSEYAYRKGGRRGTIVEPSSKALADEADYVYALISTGGVEDRRAKRNERYSAKEGALALKNPRQIAEANNERYRSLLAQKNTAEDNVDALVKHFMDKYSKLLSDVPMPSGDKKSEVYSSEAGSLGAMKKNVRDIQLKMHNLLEHYEKYLYAVNSAKSGKMYAHQDRELKSIRETFKKWEGADEVDPFKGEVVSDTTMNHLRKSRR